MEAAVAQVTVAQAAVAPVTVAQAAVAQVTVAPVRGAPVSALPIRPDEQVGQAGRDGLADLLTNGTVRSGREASAGSGALPDADLLPVLPALRDLLPHGALQRGSVVAAGNWNLLCVALAAGPVAAGAWCAVAGITEFGVPGPADARSAPSTLPLSPGLSPDSSH